MFKRDHFASVVFGKFYKNRLTKLFALGIERVASDPFTSYGADPEQFWLVLGLIGAAHDP